MIINHNMASLNTYRQMSTNMTNTSKSLEKLSSGLRINKAGDDAAGLAISEKMRGQIRGLDQAARNGQDGISMIQTAEGSLSETHSILQRMKELATQSANDTNTTSDRSEIQKEMNQLTSEVNRIGNTTEFNTQKLLNGGGFVQKTATVGTTTVGAPTGDIADIKVNTKGVAQAQAVYDVAVDGSTIEVAAGGVFKIDTDGDGTYEASLTEGVDFTGHATPATAYGNLKTALEGVAAIDDNFDIAVTATGLSFTAKTTAAGGAYDGNAGNAVQTSGDSVTGQTRSTDGATEVRGNFSFDVNNAFADASDTFTLRIGSAGGTLAFTDGSGFTVGDTAEEQAKSIVAKINADGTFGAAYSASVQGTKIVVEQKAAAATSNDLQTTVETSTAVAGQYDLEVSASVEAGGKYTVDGVDIKVTADQDDAGLVDGTAVLVGATKDEQAANLRAAVNLNAGLKDKYVATVTNNTVTLTQQATHETATAPEIKTSNNAGKFEAKFQIGANTAQSMTIEVNDMRSEALKISGTTAGATVTASNGNTATLKATKEVTDGTNNTSTEYALDVSTHDKATAAISVLDDAIQSVSAERSKLGAYTNRLEHTITNLGTSSENLTSAESRVRDVDMAKEMMQFQKNNILSQAAQAMMAQANQQPQGVLQLLR